MHVCSGHQVTDLEAHSGRRVWSIAHSRLRPFLAASASDDRTIKLWAGRGLSTCAITIPAPSGMPACCVDFSPHHEHLLAVVSAAGRPVDTRARPVTLLRVTERLQAGTMMTMTSRMASLLVVARHTGPPEWLVVALARAGLEMVGHISYGESPRCPGDPCFCCC